MKDILSEITRLRLERGWTEYDLAKNSGITQSTISSWYRKKQTPTIQSLDKICSGFGMTLSQFFNENDDCVFLSDDQRDMLDFWSSLAPKQRKAILELLKSIKD